MSAYHVLTHDDGHREYRRVAEGTALPGPEWVQMTEQEFAAATAQPSEPPEQVTKRQLLHWLEFDHGVADPETAFVAAITQHVPEQMRAFALKDWSRTYYIKRDNPLVPLLAQVLGIADVDAAFREMEEKYG